MSSDHTPRGLPQKPELPRLEHQVKPPKVYLVALDEARWRIVDCVMTQGTLRRTALESPRATCRIFLRGEVMRHYGRKPRESWKLIPATLQQQLDRSVLASTPFAPDEPDVLP